MLKSLLYELNDLSSPEKAKHSLRFFKTEKGGYGYGDVFRGIIVPKLRLLSKKYKTLKLVDIENILNSKYHEDRLLGLFIMVLQFQNKKADFKIQESIYKLYLKNIKAVNNWDLVDISAYHIIGAYLNDKNKDTLYNFAYSENLWKRRIAMISCFYYIKNNDFTDALKIAEILLYDKEDLIQKAVGWMLREIGKRDKYLEQNFLDKYHKTMPRTMLRYSIEKFSKEERAHYMAI